MWVLHHLKRKSMRRIEERYLLRSGPCPVDVCPNFCGTALAWLTLPRERPSTIYFSCLAMRGLPYASSNSGSDTVFTVLAIRDTI